MEWRGGGLASRWQHRAVAAAGRGEGMGSERAARRAGNAAGLHGFERRQPPLEGRRRGVAIKEGRGDAAAQGGQGWLNERLRGD